MRKFSFLWSVMLALPLQAGAMQPLITDDTATQGPWRHQLELSLAHEREYPGRMRELGMTYTFGLSERVDVFATAAHQRTTGTGPLLQGWTPGSLGAKWRLLEIESARTSFALKPVIRLPVSTGREQQGWGPGRVSGNLALIVSREMAWGDLHFNLASGRDRFRPGSGQPEATVRSLSVAPVWTLSEHWKLAADLGLEQVRSAEGPKRTRWMEWALIHQHSPESEWALGWIRSTPLERPGVTASTLNAGWTWRF
ncbi:MAG: hypothetical protein ACOVQL_03865 [Limnohabitans sp.]